MSINKFSIIFIVVLTIFSFALRIYRINEPPKYYFDEVYHAVTAKAYADNNPDAYDPFSPAPKEGTAYDWLHPPLAKLIQAGSIKIFGDVPLGWRLPSVIFGTAIIPATFALAYLLFGPMVAIFAGVIIAFENLTYVMSRITMNDVFVSFFILVAFIFAVLFVKTQKRQHLLMTSNFLGLALSSKWTGLYAILAVALYFLWNQIAKRSFNILAFLPIVILPPLIYLGAYGQFWLQGHNWSDFVNLHKQIWWYQHTRNLEHSYATTPLFCVPKGLDGTKTWCPWVLNIRGVYFSYEQYDDKQSLQSSQPEADAGLKAGYIYALGNPLTFWLGVVGVSFILGKLLEERLASYWLVLLGYFVFWIPWILTPRVLFLYHYLPSIPFLAIALGFGLSRMKRGIFIFFPLLILGLLIATFFYFLPISAGWPIEASAIDKFMWFETWR